MAAGLEVLASQNITRVARALVDQATLPQPLLFYNRALRVPASDDEITARETAYVFAADIISADSQALIRDAGQYTFERTKIAKIKHGFGLSESQVQLLDRIENAQASNADILGFKSYVANRTRDLILGVQQREESLIIGMLLDGYTYDRLGIKVSGSWGMPSDLKGTPAGADWDVTASSSPITDILAIKVAARETYGEMFNRITMSSQALEYLVTSNQFAERYKARMFNWDVPTAAIGASDDPNMMAPVVGSMLGMQVEVYDGMYREHKSDGSIATPTRFLPENVVLFTNSSDDNSSNGWDFGAGVIMETLIGRLGGTSVYGGFPAADYGPVAYATQADPMLNPPGIAVWAVDRGAPRKHRPTASAKLTVF